MLTLNSMQSIHGYSIAVQNVLPECFNKKYALNYLLNKVSKTNLTIQWDGFKY
jgi:hypothetical protein